MILPKFLIKSKTRKNLFFFFAGCLSGIIVLLAVAGFSLIGINKKYQDRVYPNIYLFSTPIFGKNHQELTEFLIEKEKEISKQEITFYWNNNEEKNWQLTPVTIDFSLDIEKIVTEIMAVGRLKNRFQNWLAVGRLLVFPKEVKPIIKYDQNKLDLFIKQLSMEVDRPVQEALLEFKKGKVADFQVSKNGYQTDQEETKKLIILAFSRQNFDQSKIALDLPVKTISPKITTDQTNNLGIKEELAQGTSYFMDSIPTRVHNIILASSYFHGVVVPPGEIFSFAQKIGSISAQVGYQPAYVIKEKKTVLEDGGGVCQVSTTLFRAALNAGLPIIERQAHYYRVGFYEQGGYPPGLDATVYPPSPDFKFKNDTPAYLLIQTVIDKDNKRLTFEFYGTNDNRKVEITKPVIHSQTGPPEPIYIDESTLPLGVTKRLDTAHWGAKVSFSRKVIDANNNLKEEKTWWSNYVAWPAVYQRGTKT